MIRQRVREGATTKSCIVNLIMDSKQGALEVAALVKGSSFVFMNTVNYNGITLYTLCIRIDDGRHAMEYIWATGVPFT